MMKANFLTAVIGVLFLMFCSVVFSNDAEGRLTVDGITSVSIVNLIATPNKFHDKKVRVEGFAQIVFEGNALYLTRDDANHLNAANAVWLNLNKDIPEPSQFNRKWVLVEGIFDAKKCGHGGMFSGAMIDIQRMEVSRQYYND